MAPNSILVCTRHPPLIPSSYLRSHVDCFADGQLTDALKHLATDSTTDPKVRKKVMAVLASWSRQFKDDRSAAGIAGLYRQVKPAQSSRKPEIDLETLTERDRDGEQRQRVKEEAKRKAREKRLKLEGTKRKKATSQTTSTPSQRGFDFEQVCFPPTSTCSQATA